MNLIDLSHLAQDNGLTQDKDQETDSNQAVNMAQTTSAKAERRYSVLSRDQSAFTGKEANNRPQANVQPPKWRKQKRTDEKGAPRKSFPSKTLVLGTAIVVLLLLGSIASFYLATYQTHDLAMGSITPTLITLATGVATLALSFLLFGHKNDTSIQDQVSMMHERFETLEDKAWELSESEERYKTIAESFGDMLVLRSFAQEQPILQTGNSSSDKSKVTEAGQIVFCNEEYANCFGVEPNEIIQSNFKPVPIEALTSANSVDQSAKGDGNSYTYRASTKAFETANGIRWFSWLDLPVRDPRMGDAMIMSVARDITDFKNAEIKLTEARRKAEQSSNAKSRFLGMVSHEMRTPLNGILGMSKLLESTSLTKEQLNYAQSIGKSGDGLLTLIEDMLDLTMIEAGRFEIKQSEFSITKLAEEVIELMSERAHSKNIGLGLFVEHSVPNIVTSDRNRLRQILLNLIGNAIKFTSTGGVALRIFSNEQSEETSLISIEVVDTGPGLSAEDQLRIFEEFERVDDLPTRSTAGAGLGLAISKALATQLNADLKIKESSPNGSTFQLSIAIENGTSDPLQNPTILVGKNILIASPNSLEADCLLKQIAQNAGKPGLMSDIKQIKDLIAKKDDGFDMLILDVELLEKDVELSEMLSASGRDNLPKITWMAKPDQRSKILPHLEKTESSYLIRPIRQSSLLSVLSGEASSISAEQNTAKPEITSEKLAGHHILLVEDNPINTLLAKASLEKNGARVTHAENGEQAIEQFQSGSFDLILMDMHMPVMDGLEATKAIRKSELERGLSQIPILALSADEQPETRALAEETGMNDFLTKPIDPSLLVEMVLNHTN